MLDDGSGGTWQLGTDGSRPVASRLTIRHSCCAASAPPPPRSQGRPGSVLPVCQLLLEVPALPQELSTGGYYPKQNKKHFKFKYLECQHLQHKHCLIHKNSNYSLLGWRAGCWVL